jgi:hypothetical protein
MGLLAKELAKSNQNIPFRFCFQGDFLVCATCEVAGPGDDRSSRGASDSPETSLNLITS